jgi:signal transduction histidine kinase
VDLAHIARAQVIEHEEGYPEELAVSRDVPESAPVAGDVLLESVLDNLLENAVEHAEALPVHVDVELEQDGEGYVLRVADDGPGLPERERELLEAGRKTALERSSGMGLWLVNWIVREFDGEVRVESGDGGTTFEIWLPEARGEDEDGVGSVSEVGSGEAVGDVQAI